MRHWAWPRPRQCVAGGARARPPVCRQPAAAQPCCCHQPHSQQSAVQCRQWKGNPKIFGICYKFSFSAYNCTNYNARIRNFICNMRHDPITLAPVGCVWGTVSPGSSRGQGTELLSSTQPRYFWLDSNNVNLARLLSQPSPAQPSPASQQPTQMLQEVIFNFDLLIR